MTKFFYVLIAVTLAFSAQANTSDFDSFIGCYETRKIDGKFPSFGDDYASTLSSIEKGESPFFRSLERERLDHVIINLYLGSSGPWNTYHPFVLFPKLGTSSLKDGILLYQMSDDLLFYDNFNPSRVDHHIDLEIKRLDNDHLKGRVSFRSNSRELQGERTFELRPVGCL